MFCYILVIFPADLLIRNRFIFYLGTIFFLCMVSVDSFFANHNWFNSGSTACPIDVSAYFTFFCVPP